MSSPSWSPESLKLLRGVGDPGKYVWSAFVNKLEARLRFDGLTYTIGEGSPLTAPRGKIPYIELHEAREDSSGEAADGKPTIMSDSALIIRALVSSGRLRDRNAVLTPAQRAHDLGIQALLEDRAYFYGVREKWCDNYQEMVDNVLLQVPWPLRPLVGWMVRRASVRTLYGQGTGRLTDEEMRVLNEEVWESVEALLLDAKMKSTRSETPSGGGGVGDLVGRRPFWVLGGEEPSEADATLFGFIVAGLICTASPATQALICKSPHVVEYAERIHDVYFPDYEMPEVA